MINRDRILANFLQMVQIDSPALSERQLADWLKGRLYELGAVVWEDQAGASIGGNAGNLIAWIPGRLPSAPVVGLSAHMDCVQPCCGVRPVVEDGVIRSDGTTVLGGDDKAGLAAILEGLQVLREGGIAHGGLQVILTVAEEDGLGGSRHLERQAVKADCMFVFDGGGVPGETVITSAPFHDRLDVTVYGRAAHAGVRPEAGINAIVLAARGIAAVPAGRIDQETTANIGVITGGRATNIVPDQVRLSGEVRSRDRQKLAVQTGLVKQAFTDAAAAGGGRAEVQVVREYDGYCHDPDQFVVQLAVRAGRRLGLTTRTRA
ncbi:MAG: M20/M25/M40 family metallo-hydrolase, partial [Negativicutes bacterium]|nr:M20/M25/M40 family metallo-hydrolase [Negativicutes bacterium]